ncbi:MAG: PEP-CTERM sorting domain-containing protein [Pirellulales bacterium]
MHPRTYLFVLPLLCLPALARAEVIVTAGNHQLLPDTPSQTITILITATADEAAHLMDFTAGIAGGIGPAPIITAMDINGAGTLFDTSLNTSMVFHFGPGFEPPGLEVLQRVEFDEDALNVPIGVNQLLATLTIDTSGFTAGAWALNLLHTNFDDLFLASTAGEIPVTLVPGSITIVPEPAALALACMALAAVVAVGARKRRR